MIIAESRRIAVCRVCGYDKFTDVLDLGVLAPCGVFPKNVSADPPRAPLEVVRCDHCGLVQLAHDLNPNVTFTPEGFGYRSGTNPSMVMHLKHLADGVALELKPGDTVVDIGSNDGTFLKLLPDNLRKVGVDPVALHHASNYPTGCKIIADFWSKEAAEECAGAKVITCFAALYDLPDPVVFMVDVMDALADDGVFVCEVAFLPFFLKSGAWDVISHEHLMYFDSSTIGRLMESVGMRVGAVEGNDINGGSLWFTARKNIDGETVVPQPWSNLRTLDKLRADVTQTVTDCAAFFHHADERGAVVHGYAASTRGNTLLQVLADHGVRVDVMIDAICDANPDKIGKRTPGTLIPIISEADSRDLNPDYYFVLASHFIDSFVQRERGFLERGGRFVVPFPRFRIIGKEALG